MTARTMLAAMSVVALLGACSQSSPDVDPAPSTSSTSPSPSATEPTATTPLRSESPGKSSHVQVDLCTASSTKARAGGTVENPGRRTETYRIQVFFTDEDGKVIGNTQVEVDAAPEKATRWRAAADLAYPAHPRCVLGEVR